MDVKEYRGLWWLPNNSSRKIAGVLTYKSSEEYLVNNILNATMLPDILKNILIAGCGSFLGGAARYIISITMKGVSKGFPWGTLLINLAGCLLIGLIWGYFSRTSSDGSSWSLFLTIGVCGGFTTFSTFSKEALTLLQCGNYTGFASYIAISVIAGIVLVALGYALMR